MGEKQNKLSSCQNKFRVNLDQSIKSILYGKNFIFILFCFRNQSFLFLICRKKEKIILAFLKFQKNLQLNFLANVKRIHRLFIQGVYKLT